MSVPSRLEATVLLLSLGPPPWHLRHSRAVAEVAGWLAARAQQRGVPVDRALVEAAALLHDIEILHLYPNSALKVIPAVYLGPGTAVWLFARAADHIGASGLIYGLVSYMFVAGLIRRDRRAIAASLLVYFLYGTLAWGVLPIKPELSWETHLAAALIGLVLAIALRRLDIPPRKRYAWEDEGDEYKDV